MRRSSALSTSLFVLIPVLLQSTSTVAHPVDENLPHLEDQQDVQKRCENPCGYYGQLCCSATEVCYTDTNDEAQCGHGQVLTEYVVAATQTGGSWQVFTTTFVMTNLETITTTYSSFISNPTPNCLHSLGETLCGDCCCVSGEFCKSGVCTPINGGGSDYYSSLFTVTTIITESPGQPLRPTSGTTVTLTASGATTTGPFQTPAATQGGIIIGTQTYSGHGLSGGAIAGIVIGVIAAIILFLIICLCLCAKEIIDGFLALFGLGPRRRRVTEETTIVEDRRSHRGNRTWFGTGRRPSRSDVVEKRTSGWGGAATVATFLGGLALLLGLKRRRDRRRDDKSTDYSSSYYSEYTSRSKWRSILLKISTEC